MTRIPTPEQWQRMSWYQRQQLLRQMRASIKELASSLDADDSGWQAYRLRYEQAQAARLERNLGQPP